MARQIDLGQLMKYPLRRGSEHCDEKNADPRFLNGVESVLEWAQTLPTLTPPNELPTCYQPDGDGCAYQCYDGDDEPIDKCKECPLCYSDKQRHHTPPNEWVSVEERLPENGQIVLFHQKDGFIYCAEYFVGKELMSPEWFVDNDSWNAKVVTHWMPLPAPPEKENSHE